MTYPAPSKPGLVARLADQPLARVVAYYLLLAAVALALYQVAPTLPGVFTSGRFDQLASPSLIFSKEAVVPLTAREAALEAIIAMVGSYLLMLPVAWVYVFTRQKRGYQQSLVQTLMILPIVVAAIVVLVKTSVPLAFGLGGIVGAVAFRNRLEDTKDAIQIFLTIGVGLACGAQMMSVAVVLSVFYNFINLTLWWTDFGRSPAAFDGPPAQRRLAELRQAQARRTGAFVAQVDSMLLKSMTPEQLKALAERAQKRRERLAEDFGLAVTGELKAPRFDATIRIVAAGRDVDPIRRDVETALGEHAKFWQLEAVTTADLGRQTILYKIKLKRTVPGPALLEAVRRVVVGRVLAVDLT